MIQPNNLSFQYVKVNQMNMHENVLFVNMLPIFYLEHKKAQQLRVQIDT